MFVGTFDHAETESTAAVIVKVLALNGDVWRVATCEELAAGFELLVKDLGPWRSWFNNPFISIDMHDLVGRGFARWVGENGIEFTEHGLSLMVKWVSRAENVLNALSDAAQGMPGARVDSFLPVARPQSDIERLAREVATAWVEIESGDTLEAALHALSLAIQEADRG